MERYETKPQQRHRQKKDNEIPGTKKHKAAMREKRIGGTGEAKY